MFDSMNIGDFSQLSAGGVIAILLIKLILDFFKDQRKSMIPEASGGKSPEYWKLEFTKIVTDVNKTTLIPILDRQTKILDGLQENMRELVSLSEARARRRNNGESD